METEKRLQQWLEANGFHGSVAFNLAFWSLQVIFYAVIVIALVLHMGRGEEASKTGTCSP